MSGKSLSKAIKVFKRLPKELFRVNSGWKVQLRPQQGNLPRSAAYFDIITKDDVSSSSSRRVEAKALDPTNYKAPNGAMMLPNTAFFQQYASKLFKGTNVIVYSVQEGTQLPDDLILVQETPNGEQWTIQPAKEMTLEELNEKITRFLIDNGAMMTRKQWSAAYPKHTEPRGPTYPLRKNWKVSKGNDPAWEGY